MSLNQIGNLKRSEVAQKKCQIRAAYGQIGLLTGEAETLVHLFIIFIKKRLSNQSFGHFLQN